MSAEILDQAARERTLGVRPEVGLRSETGNNGESLRKEVSCPLCPITLAKSRPACSLEHGPRKEPVVGMQVPFLLSRTGLQKKTGIAHPGNYWFGFDFHSKQSSQPELVSDLKSDY